jgi:hypothetical protein
MPQLTATEQAQTEPQEAQQTASPSELLLSAVPASYGENARTIEVRDPRSGETYNVPAVMYGYDINMPVCDAFDGASRELLNEVYTQDVLQAMAEPYRYNCEVVRCAQCSLHSIRLSGQIRITATDGTEKHRRYFPHSMEQYSTAAGAQYLCQQCRAEGHTFCNRCGSAGQSFSHGATCDRCHTEEQIQNRRRADGFSSFRRTNDKWTEDSAQCRFGFELEYADIEGRRQLAAFIKKDFPLRSKSIEVKTDGSVRQGMEIAAGYGTLSEVIEDAESVCKAMQFFPHTGNRAGLHVHASFPSELAEGAEMDMLFYRVCSLWSMLEPLMVAAVPAWRKNNEFSHDTFTGFVPVNAVRSNIHSGRYYTLNYSARSKYGTLEFRLFPSSSRADMVTGYVRVIGWLFNHVWETRGISAEEWSKGDAQRETARTFFMEALNNEESPNFRFLARAIGLAKIPAQIADFIIERIGYTLIQNIKMEKEEAHNSMFTQRTDRSLPSYSFAEDRNSGTLTKLRNTFKKREQIKNAKAA